jgi:hypothetical protein
MLNTTTLFVLFGFAISSARAAGPTLSKAQIQAAIQKGSRYKTVDKFLDKGLRGNRVKLAGAMAVDGISKYVTFYNDWQAVASESAAANQQMRELKITDIQSQGLLHAFVEVHARGAIPTSKLDGRYREQRAHLVLKMGDRVIQPIEKNMIAKSDGGVAMVLTGVESGKVTLNFAFDVSPEDLKAPVEVILIDGAGNRHQQKADLDGILNLE